MKLCEVDRFVSRYSSIPVVLIIHGLMFQKSTACDVIQTVVEYRFNEEEVTDSHF